MEGVSGRLRAVRERIRAAGGEHVTVVAVTKGFGRHAVEAAAAAGVEDLGENYAAELAAKADAAPGARWHFLGAIQRRKVRSLAPLVAVWQTVDRDGAAREVARRSPGAAVFVQVNVSGHTGRPGCAWDEAPQVVSTARHHGLDVRGLMCVASPDPSVARAEFRRLASLREELSLDELSMGMSDDLELAVEEGSTMVRVGTALFGPRPSAGRLQRYSSARGGL